MVDPRFSMMHAIVFAQGGEGGFGPGMLPLLLMIGVLFYFMVLRPESQRRAAQQKMHQELKKNDRVLTAGGIYGTVVSVQEGSDDVTIKVDESTNTRLRITRSSVQAVLNKDNEKDVGEKKQPA